MTTVDIEGVQYGLGRATKPDARDGLFGVRRVQQASARVGRSNWGYGFPALNQGSEGTCVGHAFKHRLLAAPVIQGTPTSDPTARTIYAEACMDDEWLANYDPATGVVDYSYGTSGRAGANALKKRGLIGSYVWGQSVEEIGDFVLDQGPMCIGTAWLSRMSGSFKTGGVMDVTGDEVGGHEYVFLNVDWDKRLFEVLNSWGNWGPFGNGRAWMTFADAERLIFGLGGDACGVTETVLEVPTVTKTFADAKNAAVTTYAAMYEGKQYSSAYYQRRGAKRIVDAIIYEETR